MKDRPVCKRTLPYMTLALANRAMFIKVHSEIQAVDSILMMNCTKENCRAGYSRVEDESILEAVSVSLYCNEHQVSCKPESDERI